VSSEQRGRCRIYKLRYRSNGKQCVRYLGSDAAVAAALQSDLEQLQGRRRCRRHEAALRHQARRLWQRAKALAPSLAEHGLHFHGRTVRQYRDGRFGDQRRRSPEGSPHRETLMNGQESDKPAPAVGQPQRKRRSKVFNAYRRQRVTSGPLQSALRQVNADFMELNRIYVRTLTGQLREEALSADNAERYEPLLLGALQTGRQVTALTHLEMVVEARTAAAYGSAWAQLALAGAELRRPSNGSP
jgi:hypothetical protein